jgi:hypothetical protein
MGTGEKAVRDIVRSVIASQAGHELPYYARLARSGDSWVLWRLRHQRGRSGPLEFGLSEMATLATPIVWITLNEAAQEFGSAAGDGMFAGVRALLRRLLRRKPKPAIIPPLTEEQRQKVRDAVRESLLKKKLSQQRADDIANAVYYELSPKPTAPVTPGTDPAPVKE